MGAFAKGIVSLSSQTTEEKRAYLDQRCERLKWSRAAAVSEIIDFWLALGAPPLSPGDDGDKEIPIPASAAVALPAHWERFRNHSTSRPIRHGRALSGHTQL